MNGKISNEKNEWKIFEWEFFEWIVLEYVVIIHALGNCLITFPSAYCKTITTFPEKKSFKKPHSKISHSNFLFYAVFEFVCEHSVHFSVNLQAPVTGREVIGAEVTVP